MTNRFNLNLIACETLLRKEIVRIMRIWSQTLVPPVITQSLYFIIFGGFVGANLGAINGISYMAFLVPGLVMMAVINSAYANVSGSFFSSKFQRNIEELLVSPVPNWVIIGGYVGGGAFRGNLVGFLVFIISCVFTKPYIHHIFIILLFIVLTSIIFSLAGLLNGIYAKKFDDIAIIPTFVLTPLTYLGGVFYSVHSLPPFWQKLSMINPILYMVNGFRYGFYGFSDVNVFVSFLILVFCIVILTAMTVYCLKTGKGLKN